MTKTFERGYDSGSDFFDWTIPVDYFEAPLLAVVLYHGGSLSFEGLHTLCKDSFRVIGPLDKSRTIYITDAWDSGWIRIDVVDTTRR